jgi:PTH1 family peptidyl-tRNA hydrolase
MKIVMGLGNPGMRYTGTRHNLGRRVVEFLAHQSRSDFSSRKQYQALIARSLEYDDEVLFVCPETFMNLSGACIARLVQRYAFDFKKDLLVVTDDLALEFGRLRFRLSGSDGSHKGLKSVEQALNSRSYARLRLGIGHPAGTQTVEDYVLSGFTPAERRSLDDFVARAAEACRLWLQEPPDKAMNTINSWKQRT